MANGGVKSRHVYILYQGDSVRRQHWNAISAVYRRIQQNIHQK